MSSGLLAAVALFLGTLAVALPLKRILMRHMTG
jgi:hypothetical protein